MVDVGCGIGGSARHLARKYEAQVSAITLSPVQAARGNAICEAQGLASQASRMRPSAGMAHLSSLLSPLSSVLQVKLQVADALEQPFADQSFDFVWSMESGEHMPNKDKVRPPSSPARHGKHGKHG